MSLWAGKKITLLGIGGAGMRGLAELLGTGGALLTGVDQTVPVALIMAGGRQVPILLESAATDSLREADLVIHSDALPADHPLLAFARTAGISTMAYQDALGQLSRTQRTLAVTGTHGKSSTTSMLAHIFVAAGLDPTALVGAGVPAWDGHNARVGTSDYFIVEADEYRNHFLALQVESAIITAIDFDHPDFFASMDAVAASFAQFVQKVSASGTIVIPQSVHERWPNLPWPTSTVVVAPPREPIELILPGEHMQSNAWLAITLAGAYGIDEASARAALRNYSGLSRRFELLGHVGPMSVVSDYGHHPTEIAATLAAARQKYPTGKICALFEAHTEERLREFETAFVDALALADMVVVVPPFLPAGRVDMNGSDHEEVAPLVQRLQERGGEVIHVTEFTEVPALLQKLAPECTLAIAFSAGKLDGVLRTFVKPD